MPVPEGFEISTTLPDIHDSEIIAAEGVVNRLIDRYGHGRHVNLEDFRKRLIDEIRTEAGLGVNVKVYSTNVENLYAFDLEINRRYKPFDPDQQVHEVQHDVLDLGEGGEIKTDKGAARALIDGDMEAAQKLHIPGHSHGNGHHHHH